MSSMLLAQVLPTAQLLRLSPTWALSFCLFPYPSQVEELLMAMEKVKQELESMKAKLSSTQQSLAEKETHLTNLRAERRKHLEEVLEMK